jgi:hypothetical protein
LPTESPSGHRATELDLRHSRTAQIPFEVSGPRPRVRHQARDAVTVAALSLAGSVVVVAAIWVVSTWLG